MRTRVIALENQRVLELEIEAGELTLRVPGECSVRLTRAEAWEVSEALDELATAAVADDDEPRNSLPAG